MISGYLETERWSGTFCVGEKLFPQYLKDMKDKRFLLEQYLHSVNKQEGE